MDEQKKTCHKCKKRKEKKCTITGEYVAKKKLCDTGKFESK
jgi:hypothetical protein